MKVPKFNLGDLVLIEWEDHYNSGQMGWANVSSFENGPMYIETVGFVIADNNDRVALSPTRHDDGEHVEYCGGASVRIKKDIKHVQILWTAKRS